MSFLWIVIIGAVAGFVGGKFMSETEHGIKIDLVLGVAGAVVGAFLLRLVGPEAAKGFAGSALIAIVSAIGTLFVARKFFLQTAMAAPPVRRRRT